MTYHSSGTDSWTRSSEPRLSSLLFSFEGRIRRSTYWGASIAAGIVLAAATYAVGAFVALPLAYVVLAVAWWVQLALTAKRLHDRNLSGWMIVPLSILPGLLTLLPVHNPLFWIGGIIGLVGLIIIGFLPGTEDDNEYGPDPRANDW